ncbi:glycerate kinase I [Citrobacter koseri]|uniref:Glycerate kinase I n=1 Tax=Citrobacter koseri TaxID=545 RepID=A0A2X2WAK6_CITKO|nr:glycerate kinase I [Citrobacter koseri]
MKIVIAPDSYKESLSAAEVAQAIEKGFREIFPDAQYVSIPVADGGEGTVEAMICRHAWNAVYRFCDGAAGGDRHGQLGHVRGRQYRVY